MLTQSRLVVLVLLLLFTMKPNPARGGETSDSSVAAGEAERLLQRGRDLLNQRKYDAALASFSESNRLWQSPQALVNIGVCLVQLHRKFEAIQPLEEGLRLHGSIKNRKQVEELLRETRALLPRLSVSINETDAEISIDGRSVGQSPLAEPILLLPGLHQVSASKAGFDLATSAVRIPDIDRHESQMVLTLARTPVAREEPTGQPPEPTPVASPPPGVPPKEVARGTVPTPAPEPSVASPATPAASPSVRPPDLEALPARRRWTRWKVAAVGSAALGVGGIATGIVLAVRTDSQFDTAKQLCTNGCEDPTGKAANANALLNADRATTAFVAAGVALAAALVLWLLDH